MPTTDNYGTHTQQVLAALEELGPSTTVEIARHLGVPKMEVSRMITRLTRRTPRSGKRAHILQWVRDSEGQRDYPRPVYALGDKPDAKKPKPAERVAMTQAFREKKKAQARMNFVFNLAGVRT